MTKSENQSTSPNTQLEPDLIFLQLQKNLSYFQYKFSSNLSSDEILSIHYYVLGKVLATYQETESANLSTYYNRVMFNELVCEWRKQQTQHRLTRYTVMSEEQVIQGYVGNQNEEMLRTLVCDYLKTLKPPVRLTLNLFSEGYTQYEISQLLNIHQTTVSLRLRTGINKLRQYVSLLGYKVNY